MATVRPFAALRPAPDLADKIAALPYDVMNTAEAREMVKGNPHSFLHIDRAEIDLAEDINPYDPAVYAKARENLDRMINDGEFIEDGKPCLYIYRLIRNGAAQIGIGATVSVDEYENGTIKKHELTRAEKEQDRINHVDITDAQTGPIFLTYRHKDEINAVVNGVMESKKPVYDFVAEDGISHTVWVIYEDETIEKLTKLFATVPNLYIADGHHRNASAAKVCKMRRDAAEALTGKEEFNFYLAVLFPDNQLNILDYNRVVKDLNGMAKDEFLAKIGESFAVSAPQKDELKPKNAATFGMYLDGMWYLLTPKAPVGDDPVLSLDVSVLQDRLLTPVLGIGDVRTDNRIDFVGGIRGLGELKARVDSGEMAVAFSMFPTSITQLMNIADDNKLMPPKSTWFEPKLRSGLLIHRLSD